MTEKNYSLKEFFDNNPHVSKTDFAEKCHMDRTAIYNYLSGSRSPTLIIAVKMYMISNKELSLLKLLTSNELKELDACLEASKGLDAL